MNPVTEIRLIFQFILDVLKQVETKKLCIGTVIIDYCYLYLKVSSDLVVFAQSHLQHLKNARLPSIRFSEL